MQTLMVKSGPRYRRATAAEIAEVAGQYALNSLNKARPVLSGPRETAEALREVLAGLDYEVFCVVHLDSRHRLIECEQIFRGTIDGASVHTREVVKSALWRGSASVVLAHNHPSGEASPSQADELITRRLRDALGLIDVRVLDHVIIAGGRHFSFAQGGLI